MPRLLDGDKLTAAMVGIGMMFAAEPAPDADVEDTLISASIEGMDRGDLRVLAILITWLGVHAAWINADRLARSLEHVTSRRVRAFWAAFAHWKEKDRRFARFKKLHRGKRVDVMPSGTTFHLQRSGEHHCFVNSPLRLPADTLRDRAADVMTPEELASCHRTYRWRIIMGPSYRADMWAVMEADPSASAFSAAQRTRGSFNTARQVQRERQLIVGDAVPSTHPNPQ